MSSELNKQIKLHALAFGGYSVCAVIGIYLGIANRTFFFIMLFYAAAIGIHAIAAMIHLSYHIKGRTGLLKAFLFILALILVGFGLCISPSVLHDL